MTFLGNSRVVDAEKMAYKHLDEFHKKEGVEFYLPAETPCDRTPVEEVAHLRNHGECDHSLDDIYPLEE